MRCSSSTVYEGSMRISRWLCVCFSSIYAGCTAVLVSFSMCGTGTSKQGGTNSFSDTCPAAGSTEIWRVEYFISDEGRCVCAYGGLFSGAASPLKAYDLACEEGFLPCMIDASMHIANCYSAMHAEGVMLMYYERCEHLCRSSKNKQMQAHVWYNIGSTYQQLGDFQKGCCHCF